MVDLVPSVRAFNRFYTHRLGLLGEGFLHSPYTLSEARVLFELAQRNSTEVADLRRSLDLDAGHLNRMLAQLDAEGLVARQRCNGTWRQYTASLTEQGRSVVADLEARSSQQIRDWVATLTEADQARLAGAISTVRELMDRAPQRRNAVCLRTLRPGEIGWVVQRHGALYAKAYGWDASFEAMVARVMADYAAEHDPQREAAWIAEVDGAPVGCVMCVREDDTTARLRVLLVEPSARGKGIGSALVQECIRFARSAGYHRLVLLTYDVLAEARRIYQRAGFRLAKAAHTHAYGHDLVEEHWSRDL